jgi:hypothetical protein
MGFDALHALSFHKADMPRHDTCAACASRSLVENSRQSGGNCCCLWCCFEKEDVVDVDENGSLVDEAGKSSIALSTFSTSLHTLQRVENNCSCPHSQIYDNLYVVRYVICYINDEERTRRAEALPAGLYNWKYF